MPVYPDVSFSQVYTETAVERKTLHNPENLISDGFTSILNVGNFNFTVPVMDSTAFGTLLSIMFKSSNESHTLYLENEGVIKRYNQVVFTDMTFNTAKNSITTVSVSGNYGYGDSVGSIPGVTVDYGELYTYIEGIGISIAGVNIPYINNFNIEVKNDVKWLDNKTIHDNGPVHRNRFVHTGKIIGGNIIQYSNIEHSTYSDNSPMLVQIKSNGGIFLEFDFPTIINTSRPQLDLISKKGIDFRVNGLYNNKIRFKGVNIL